MLFFSTFWKSGERRATEQVFQGAVFSACTHTAKERCQSRVAGIVRLYVPLSSKAYHRQRYKRCLEAVLNEQQVTIPKLVKSLGVSRTLAEVLGVNNVSFWDWFLLKELLRRLEKDGFVGKPTSRGALWGKYSIFAHIPATRTSSAAYWTFAESAW